VDLYLGQFLENETIQEWFMTEVQFYHQLFLRLMDYLSEKAIEENDLDLAISNLELLKAKDKLYEPAYSLLMKIYYQQGNLGMLRQVYQQCQQVMERQLNSSVSEDIKSLYQQLLNRENGSTQV
jgi:DNA-binding SARP family transcriptional activator